MAKQLEHTNSDVHTEESVGHADTSVAASLGLNTQLFVFQLINFEIVGAIVWFMILKPLISRMDERKKLVDESIDNAKEIETNCGTSETTIRKFYGKFLDVDMYGDSFTNLPKKLEKIDDED